jgi:hypothetical protein
MKKIIALVLVLSLSAFCFAACKKDKGNDEKDYTLAIAIDSSIDEDNKLSNYAAAIVLDSDNKIVAARIDCAETTIAIADGAIADATVTTKVELGENYKMPKGSWADQAKAFENAIVGKTADEVANLDSSLYAGCTMQATTPIFKALVAKAFAYTNKVTFTTAETFTTGIAVDASVANGKGGKISVGCDVAGVVMAGGKVVACAIDSVEQSYTVAEGALVAGALAVSKNEQGEEYKMPNGTWVKQAQAFANSTVGKTAADLANLEVVSDALAQAGCTMQNTTAGYKVTIISAVSYAR